MIRDAADQRDRAERELKVSRQATRNALAELERTREALRFVDPHNRLLPENRARGLHSV